ncbi:MAG: sulfite exporter TauE/SafE family protein, partial [Burkholderiales bacterium]|nr:sulfite exporter TauE/SafE family protein [Burkholderiales bacterium]
FWLFRLVDAEWLVKTLALFLIGVGIYQLRSDGNGQRVSALWALPAGGFGGLVGTLFGTGGPFYVAYLHGRQLDKVAFRATFSTIFLLDGANRIVSYALAGFLNERFFGILLWLAPMMALGIFVGRHLHADISQKTFRRGISVLLLLSGGILLFK